MSPRATAHRRRLRPAYTALAIAALVLGPAVAANGASRTGKPIGNVDKVTAVDGGVRVQGWAWDPDTTASTSLTVVAGIRSGQGTATEYRPDVARAIPDAGAYRGFDLVVPTSSGAQQVCVTATNVGSGSDKAFACAVVTVTGEDPVGNLDIAREQDSGLRVEGWAADRDATAPITVRLAVDGRVQSTTTASNSRPDVARAVPGVGAEVGFSADIAVAPGEHEVCATALNAGGGSDRTFTCRTVTVVDHSPQGTLDTVADSTRGGLSVAGRVTDADVPGPIDVRLTVDGEASTVTTDATAPHTFAAELPAAPGGHRVCATALNVGPGSDTDLGCRDAVVVNHAVVGNLDKVVAEDGTIRVAGWAADRDSATPLEVRILIDTRTETIRTGDARPDVARAFPELGSATGFGATFPALPGEHRVCATGVNVGAGLDASFPCLTVTVAAPAPEPAPEPEPEPTQEPEPEPSPALVPDTVSPRGDRVGVPAATVLTVHEGDLTVTTPGTVIDGLDIHGYLRIKAADVTVRNTVVRGRAGLTGSMALIQSSSPGVRIIDSELVADYPTWGVDGFVGSHATLTNVDIHGVIDSVKITGDNVIVENSWLHDNLYFDTTPSGHDTHNDNVQIAVGKDIVVRDSVLSGTRNAGVMVTQDRGAVSGFVFTRNWADNGACTINLAEKAYGPIDATITDNVFGTASRIDHCAVLAATTTQEASTISGNSFTDGSAFKGIRGWPARSRRTG